MFRFIHAADIHLDSPMKGLSQYEGAPVEEIRAASRKALENLVRLAVHEDAGFVVLSGDVFDGDWRDYSTGLFFVTQMARLGQAGIRVFLAAGNHDAASSISRSLRLPANVHVFSTRACESVQVEGLDTVIHGRGFSGRAEEGDWVAGYPEPVPGAFNIGVLHTSLAGYSAHDPYAPCSLDSLVGKGYDYWALGHVHRHEVLCTRPHVVYPGNIQGRHIRETGPKGCMLVSVSNREVVDARFSELDVLRWYRLELDARGSSEDGFMAAFRDRLQDILDNADSRFAAVRLTVKTKSGSDSPFMRDPEKWRNELRAAAIDAGRSGVWIERIVFVPEATRASGVLPADLLEGGGTTDLDDGALLQIGGEALRKLFEKLPPEITTGPEALRPDDPAWLREVFREGMERLVARLRRVEGKR